MEMIQYAWKLALTGFLTSFMFVVLWLALMLIIVTIINATGNRKL